MGVYIPEMKMPTNCYECPFAAFISMRGKTWYICFQEKIIDNVESLNLNDIPLWCNLTQVAEPHGNLIDENEIYYNGEKIHLGNLDRKVIIEAEKCGQYNKME